MNEQASELFMDIICTSGTPSGDCQLCHRTHFASGDGSCESEEEIERYRKRAEENPNRYCESHDDSISIGWIDGKQVVWNCPCHKLRKYEDFIWDNRDVIIEYIKARAKKANEESAKVLSNIA